MGRDFWVLDQWRDSGKPPLLGPQTSALPINQSAIYFYLLYPFFLLTKESPLSALFANAFIYLVPFIAGFFLFKNESKLRWSLLLVFFLISIHPQYIIQSRYIWNPSLVTPFFLIAIYSLLIFIKNNHQRFLWLFSLSLATSISLTYSIVPEALVIFGLAFFWQHKYRFKLFVSFIISLILTNLPTLIFELRHHFLLTSSLFTKQSPIQQNLSIPYKIHSLSLFLFNSTSILNYFMLFLVFSAAILIIIKTKQTQTRLPAFALLLSLLLTLVIPITVQAHYVFGLLTLIFIIISFLPLKFSLLISLLLSFVYLKPLQINQYFQSSPRTYQSMENCFISFCQQHPEPLFVTVQSNMHPYHNGPEHRYLLKKAGCQVKEIETNPQSASAMIVVGDGSDYVPGKTQYYELTQFGQSQLTSTTICQDNFKLFLLNKI